MITTVTGLQFQRIWAMPSRWTFTIRPIAELLRQEVDGGLWLDPFCGENSPAKIRNDINPEREAEFHMDALEFLQAQAEGSVDGVLYDPPYSMRQASECYKGFGKTAFVTSKKYWADCKNEIGRIIKVGGKVICCGWNSNGLGINRGFEMTRLLVVPHGGSMNDTMITVERKTCFQPDLLG
jgi:hypothetical protein